MRVTRIGSAFFLIFLLSTMGCAVQKVKVVPPAEPTVPTAELATSMPLPAMAPVPSILQEARLAELDYLEERRRVRARELESWQALEEKLSASQSGPERPAGWLQCLAQLRELVALYARQEKELAVEPSTVIFLPSEAYRSDITLQESGCGQTYQAAEAAAAISQRALFARSAEQMAQAVVQHVNDGLNAEAIAVYSTLRKTYPGTAIAPEVTMQYSIALFRSGKPDEALQVLRDSLEQNGAGFRYGTLQRFFADLLWLAGRREEARREYEKLATVYAVQKEERRWVDDQLALLRATTLSARERDLFAGVLREALLADGRRIPVGLTAKVAQLEQLYPTSMVTSRAQQLLRQAEHKMAGQVGKELVAIDQLIAQQEFDQAVRGLELLLREELSEEVRRVVQQTLDNALIARQVEMQPKAAVAVSAASQDELARQWDEANRLLGLKRYDAAIDLFAKLNGTEYAEQATVRMREASQQAATDLRREAAALFVKARKASAPQQKEQAVASWRLLRQILAKYPDSDIIPKVRDNLRSVEEYLNQLDPALLPTLNQP